MGFADNIKGAVEKGKQYATENADKVDGLVDKAGDAIDQKTGNKYADKIDQAQDAAKNSYREQDQQQEPAQQEPAQPESVQQEPVQQQEPAAEPAPQP